jgi:hypothetical protein
MLHVHVDNLIIINVQFIDIRRPMIDDQPISVLFSFQDYSVEMISFRTFLTSNIVP